MKNKGPQSRVRIYLSNIMFKFRSMSFAKHLLLFYFLITIIGALILYAPISQTNNLEWDHINGVTKHGYISFIDALFTSASAFSDTGLATYSTAITFNVFGQAVISILIFIGGIGWMALKVYVFNILFGRPVTYKTRELLSAERGSVTIGVASSLIRVAVTTLFVVIFVFSMILSVYFYYTPIPRSQADSLYDSPYHNPFVSFRWGIFHTISALNNAGFDIMGTSSLQPYYFEHGVQIIFILLFMLGGMGYPLIYDTYMFVKTRFTKERFRFSLFSKLSFITYFVVAAVGLSATYGIELNTNGKFWDSVDPRYGTHSDKAFALFFNTMSTRNAGFSTISMHDLSRATLVQYIIMMFIGSAPSSTAGGIRTTTLAIVILGIWNRLRGRQNVYAFKKRIPQATVTRSYIVFTVSIFIVIIGTLISMTSFDVHGGDVKTIEGIAQANPTMTAADLTSANLGAHDFTELIFEVGSAFGTTGLSAGMTPDLSIASKASLILIMFIGQLGVSSSILIWGGKSNSDKHYSRIKQDVAIG